MSWTSVALWAALALSGLATGALAGRWPSSGAGVPPRVDTILLAGAAVAVVTWFANAGALLSNSASNALLASFVPIDASPAYRLAVMWSTLPGSAITLGAAALILAVLLPLDRAERPRIVAALAAISLVSFGVAAWFAPRPGIPASSILPFLQSPSAAIAPLAALVSVVALGVVVAGIMAGRRLPGWQLIAWAASTAAIAAEQVARSHLGVGPRDGIVLGGASGGLVLWLLTSALMHRHWRSFALARTPTDNRRAARVAHLGALLLVLSFAAHAVASRSTVTLAPGQSVNVADTFGRQWSLANQGVSRYDEAGADILAATIEARSPGGAAALLTPEMRDYHRADGAHLDNPVSLRKSTGSGLTAVRVLLVEADSLDVTQVRVTFQPLPLLWLTGVALLAASMVLIALDHSRKPRTAV